MTAAITGDNEIEVEEAFFRTTALPDGFTVKGGRFFSGFGYLNEVHAHAWDFVDQPLVYQAMFGGQYRQDGLQVKWLAPTDLFVEFGAEIGNGDNYPATRLEQQRLQWRHACLRTSAAISATTPAGEPGLPGSTAEAEEREGGIADAAGSPLFDQFTGDSDTWVVDGVLKWAPTPRRQFKVQGEYMHRERERRDRRLAGLVLADDYRSTQSGWYLQSVYQFAPRWRVGARYDSLESGTPRYTLAPPDLLEREPRSPVADARLESQRVLALARAVRLGRRARRQRDAIASGACNTSTASARTARTSTRNQVMKNSIRLIAWLLVAAASLPAHAALKVLATTPDWGALTQELGGEQVNVYVATTALQDVHRVEAKPSLVARARSADLVVATGAELEVGWLPVLIQESGNANIQKGARGYFEAASALQVCSRCHRRSIARWATSIPTAIRTCSSIRTTSQAVAHALTARLSQLDPAPGGVLRGARPGTSTRAGTLPSRLGRRRPRRSRARRW